jgi:hypothetical protein
LQTNKPSRELAKQQRARTVQQGHAVLIKHIDSSNPFRPHQSVSQTGCLEPKWYLRCGLFRGYKGGPSSSATTRSVLLIELPSTCHEPIHPAKTAPRSCTITDLTISRSRSPTAPPTYTNFNTPFHTPISNNGVQDLARQARGWVIIPCPLPTTYMTNPPIQRPAANTMSPPPSSTLSLTGEVRPCPALPPTPNKKEINKKKKKRRPHRLVQHRLLLRRRAHGPLLVRRQAPAQRQGGRRRGRPAVAEPGQRLVRGRERREQPVD